MNPALRYTIIALPWIVRFFAFFTFFYGVYSFLKGGILICILSLVVGVVLYIISRKMMGAHGGGLGFPRVLAVGAVLLFFYGLYKLVTDEPLLGLFYMALGVVLYQVARDEAGRGGGHGGH